MIWHMLDAARHPTFWAGLVLWIVLRNVEGEDDLP